MQDLVKNSIRLIGLCLPSREDLDAGEIRAAASRLSDWELLTNLCKDRLVCPQVYASLRDSDSLDLISPEFKDKLKKIYLTNAAINTLRIKEAIKLHEALKAAGVDSLIIKGAGLVISGEYPDPGHRRFSDVDILVEHSSEEAFHQTIRQLDGWDELPDQQMLEWETTPCFDRYGVRVDVHWRIKPFAGVSGEVAWERLWKNSREVSYKKHTVRVPSREDSYIHSAVHATAHHPFDTGILFVTMSDLVRLAGNGRPSLDWERMARDLTSERLLAHVAVATEAAREFTGAYALEEGIKTFRAADPDLGRALDPFMQAFLAMARKPWVFESMLEGQVLAKPDLYTGMKFFAYWLKRQLFKRPGTQPTEYIPRPEEEIQTVFLSPRYTKKIWDLDYLRYVGQLHRFYRCRNFTTLE